MTECVGITAEYNPFHNGHAYQLAAARSASGADAAIVVMSGCFTQRGEPAIADKFTRAAWALNNGADMVLELPVPYSLGNAERFASGAVASLAATGLVNSISFGSESGDVDMLKKLAELTASDGHIDRENLRTHLAQGKTFPRAVSDMLTDTNAPAELARGLASPNDILAIEYIKAISRLGLDIGVFAIKRVGAPHDSCAECEIASARAVRTAVFSGKLDSVAGAVPKDVLDSLHSGLLAKSMPYSEARLSDLIMFSLRSIDAKRLSELPEVTEGLENAIKKAALACADYGELLDAVKSKRYTLARIKRIIMNALIGVSAADAAAAPRYIRVLGVKASAVGLLSEMSRVAALPVITRGEDAAKLGSEAQRSLKLDARAWELYESISPLPKRITPDLSHRLIVV